MSTLKERIAALNAKNEAAQMPPPPLSRSVSSTSSRSSVYTRTATSPTPGDGPSKPNQLRAKIARFDKLGGTPVPRGSFGLGAPPLPQLNKDGSRAASVSNELWGNRIPSTSSSSSSSPLSRSPSLKQPNSADIAALASAAHATSQPSRVRTISSSSGRPFLTPDSVFHDKDAPPVPRLALPGMSPSSPRAISPSPSEVVKVLGTGDALTEGALETLPASPSFKPEDMSSSVATDLDLGSGPRSPPSTVPNDAESIRSSLSADGASPIQTPPIDDSVRGREGPPSDKSITSSARSISSTSSSSSHSFNPHLQPRPETPSYISQAASYFPPSRRQSLVFPLTPKSPPPRTSSPSASSVLSSSSSTNVTQPKPLDSPPTRKSMDSVYYSTENGDTLEAAASSDDKTPQGSHFLTSKAQPASVLPNSSSPSPSTPLSQGLLDSFPAPPPTRPTISTPNTTPPASQATPNANTAGYPSPPPTALPTSPTTLAPNSSAAYSRTTTTTSSLSPASVAKRNTSAARRKSRLIPGQWIDSDNENDLSDEEEGAGWAKIIKTHERY